MSVTSVTRRELLKTGIGAAALALLPRPVVAHFGGGWEPVPPIQDPKIKELAMRAITAGRAAGAGYADVRLTHTRQRSAKGDSEGSPFTGDESEALHVGVRALVEGYWGFAASSVWSPEEMSRLAWTAAQQAKVNALGSPRPLEFVAAPPVTDGHWVMPVKRDPFEVSWLEILDVLSGLKGYMSRFPSNVGISLKDAARWMPWCAAQFFRQDRAFASTDGSYCTQRLYRSEGDISFTDMRQFWTLGVDFLSSAGMGWELFTDRQPLQDEVRHLAEELKEDLALPMAGIEIGRYDTVMDTWNTANLLSMTLGRATQLDRALGYEANANGTSYLSDPSGMLERYQAGAELLTVTANRSEPGGCATVQWDDEGVSPEAFPLVQNGTLVDFQTTREGAGWLAAAYAKQQRPVRSHACAVAPLGLDAPMVHTPNLVLEPGREAQDSDALVRTLKTGLALKARNSRRMVSRSDVDFACRNGTTTGRLYMVKNGRRVARVDDAGGLLFRSTNLWKGLLAIGDAASAQRHGMPEGGDDSQVSAESKGEPPQLAYHSVTAPPALFKQLTLIDLTREA